MDEFEFISVLVSMVVGLGIAQLLSGVGQAVHERKQAPLDEVHLAWSFAVFLSLILWAVALYLLVVFLYPARKTAAEPWSVVYASNRQWFLAAFAAFTAADIWVTALRGGLWDPPQYLPFVLHYFVLFSGECSSPGPGTTGFWPGTS